MCKLHVCHKESEKLALRYKKIEGNRILRVVGISILEISFYVTPVSYVSIIKVARKTKLCLVVQL